MSLNLEQWQYPIGRYQAKQTFLAEEIEVSIAVLKAFPTDLKVTYHNVVQRILINLIAQEDGPLNSLFII